MSLELKDRVPTRPNRKLITPEGGGTPYFATVVHADEPVEVGTPINKSTLNDILTEANAFTTSRTGINAKASRPWGDEPEFILIESVTVGVTHITFIAPSDFKQSDSYFILYSNAASTAERIKLTITDLAGEPLDDGVWKVGSPVSLIIQGDKAFFKGGGGTYGTLPPQIKQFTAKAGNHQITLSWTNPSDSNFAGLYLVRKQGSMPTKLSDGIKIDVEMATTYTDNEPENDKLYYYRAFTYNAKKQVQTELTGAVVSATPKAGIPLKSLPVGTLVVDPNTKYYNQPIMWKIADQNHSGYPSNSTTLISDKILTLKCFDAKEPNNVYGNPRDYGNNRYVYSNVRQWLNSEASSGLWYSAQHSADAPPSVENVASRFNPYDIQAGFLKGFSSQFNSSLLITTLTVAKETEIGDGGSETIANKLFLASKSEVGLGNENGIAEGSKLALFSDNNSRISKVTAACVANSNYSSNPAADAPWYWWLRTPHAASSYIACIVYADGSLSNNFAYYGSLGVRPLCNLPNDTYVNPVPNSDGSYNIVF